MVCDLRCVSTIIHANTYNCVTVLHNKVSIHCQAFQRKVSDVRWRRKCHRFYGNCTAPIKTVLNQEKVQSAKIPSNNLELASMMVIFVFHSFHWVWCTLVDRITQQFQAPFFRFWNEKLVSQIEHLSRGSATFSILEVNARIWTLILPLHLNPLKNHYLNISHVSSIVHLLRWYFYYLLHADDHGDFRPSG